MDNPPKLEARSATHPSDAGRTDDPGAGESDQRDHHHVLLLVEDDVDVRAAMQALLRLEGFKLLTAADGAEALDLLRRVESPCLILLDFSMPGINGRDFRRQQMKDPRLAAIPTVLFSAHDGIAQRANEL
jgi:CheY-like chemotaxis protein